MFDIETGPLQEELIRASAPPFNPDDVAIGNRKPETAAVYIEERRRKHHDEIMEKAALDARTGQVICVGILEHTSAGTHKSINEVSFLHLPSDEALILHHFWAIAKQCFESGTPLIGFNNFDFDLPFLVRRSWMLDVQIPMLLFAGGFGKQRWNQFCVDLLSVWRCGQYGIECKTGGMGALSKAMGGPEKTTEIGAEFSKVWIEDRPRAHAYLNRDLEILEFLATKMGAA